MFIDLTRHGGGRVLRVAVAAIAYLDACEGGTAVHLVGGETLRVIEDAVTIEERAAPSVSPSGMIDKHLELEYLGLAEDAGLISTEHAVEQRVDIVARRRGRR